MRRLTLSLLVLLSLACAGAGDPSDPDFVGTVSVDQDPDPDLMAFAQALKSGTPGTFPFAHPLLGLQMQREVKGVGHYVEQMPGGGQMEVHFRGARADELVAYFESVAVTHEIVSTGSITEEHDGRPITNPLAQAMRDDTGEVVISGYE